MKFENKKNVLIVSVRKKNKKIKKKIVKTCRKTLHKYGKSIYKI